MKRGARDGGAGRGGEHDHPIPHRARHRQGLGGVIHPIRDSGLAHGIRRAPVTAKPGIDKVGAKRLGQAIGHRADFLARGGKPVQIDQ